MRRPLTAFLLAGSFTLPAHALPDETPLSVHLSSLAANPAYRAAQAGTQAEQEGKAIAFGQLLPNISVNGERSRNETKRTDLFGTTPFSYMGYSYSVSLRQPIYRPYSIAAYQQAEKQGELAESQLAETRNELIVKVLGSYFDAVYAEHLITLLAKQKAAVEAQVRAAEKAFSAGIGTRIEISEANARHDIILAQEIEAQNQQDHALRTLRALAGRPLGRLTPLMPERLSVNLPRPMPLADWIAAAESGNAELASARAQIEIARKEVSKAGSGHYPTLDLVAGRTLSGNDSISSLNNFGDTTYRQNTIGLQLSIPIFAGGQVSASVRQAQAKLEQAQLLAEDVQQNLEVRIRDEYGNIVQGAAKIRAQEQAEASAAQSLLATRKGIQAGERSMLDVLKAEEQLYTARRDLALARYQIILARLRLLQLCGKIVDDDILQIDSWFVPSNP